MGTSALVTIAVFAGAFGGQPPAIAEAELTARLASAQQAAAAGDADGAVRAYDTIAAFYRRGGDLASAAAADHEAARLLFAQRRFDDALALLDRSEGHENASARLAERQHMRASVLEHRGDTAGAQRAIAAVSRNVTREDWNRHLADDARRLDVGYGWPRLERRWLAPLLVVEWGALAALVIAIHRRAVRRGAAKEAGEGRRV